MPVLRLSQRLFAAVIALLTVALIGAAVAPGYVEAQPRRVVLLLRGGDNDAYTAVAAALQSRGLTVRDGQESTAFTGTPQDFQQVELVVLLNGTGPATRLTTEGAAALSRFVERGGALVAGHWSLLDPGLASLMPATHCGQNAEQTTTFTRATPHPQLTLDVAQSFVLNLSPTNNSEGCLSPRDDALVLFTSSNGGGRRNAAGLASWNFGRGRVAAFSALLGATELGNADFRTLFGNTAAWLVGTRDATPPKIKSFNVDGANGIVGSRQVAISLTASDSGGSGVGAYMIREYAFSGDLSDAWDRVGTRSWQSYQQPGASFSWTLSEAPGVRYLQAFVADQAGNISAAEVVIMNYRPEQVALNQDELHIYRIVPGAGNGVEIRMDARNGNPDLYVFGPGVTFTPESDNPVEQTNFKALAGVYQIEVEGFRAGNYSLRYTNSATVAAEPSSVRPEIGPIRLDRRPRISFSSINPPVPPVDSGSLPIPPQDTVATNMREVAYLPLIRR